MAGFRNPIVAGLDLVRRAIRSPNYVAGVSGWSINRDGSAEFADALIRGQLVAGTPPYQVFAASGADLPPPLDTYLKVGLVFETTDPVYGGNPLAYYGVRNDASTIIEFGYVTGNGTILPLVNYQNVSASNIEYTFTGQNYVLFENTGGVTFSDTFVHITGDGFGATFDLFDTYTRWIGAGGAEIIIDILGANKIVEITAMNVGSFNSDWDLDAASSFVALCDVLAPNLTDPDSSFTPTVTGGGAFAIGNMVRHGDQYKQGNYNAARFELIFGTTSNQGTGAWTLGGFRPSVAGATMTNTTVVGRWWYVKPASAQRATGDVLMGAGASTVSLQAGGGLPTLGAFTAVGAAIPEAWANGAIVTCDIRYPIA